MHPVHSLRLNDHCELRLSVGDLTRWSGERYWSEGRYERCAIVNAANETLLGGGGVDGAIHRAAGPDLLSECKELKELRPGVRCEEGQVRITGGHDLPVGHIIHTVGPVYQDAATSAPVLTACYEASIGLAGLHKMDAIAFPAISCGVFGYPPQEAAEVAIAACEHSGTKLKLIEFVLFERGLLDVWFDAASRRREAWSPCPVCQLPRWTMPRYSRALCSTCSDLAVDEDGRGLTFTNVSMSGGFAATYTDSKEAYPGGGSCWVRGIPCQAEEARFGGIVIEPKSD